MISALVRKARALFRPSTKVPAIMRPPSGGSAYYGQAYHWEQVLHYKYWSFVAIRAIIREVAGGAPPQLGRIVRRDESKKRFAKRINKSLFTGGVRKSLGGPREHEEFEPYEHDHPLVKLFNNPNGPDVAYDLWAWHTLFKALTGVAHWWVIKNGFGCPCEIWVIPTHWVRMQQDKDGQPGDYFVQSPWGYACTIPFEDVVSFYDHSPLNRYEGVAVSQAISEWIDMAESQTRMQLAVFKNGALPAFHVQLGDAYADPDEAFLSRFYSKWFARFQGENNSGKPLITGADVEIKGITGHNPAEALQSSIASEEFIRDRTLAAFGVPKGVIGLEPAQDTSAYAPQRQFCRFTINPELHYIGQVITEKIVKPVDEHGVCFWDDRVVDDPEQVLAEIASRRAGASITPNEERAIFGAESYPHGGDDPILAGSPVPWVTGDKEDALAAVSTSEPEGLAATVGGSQQIMQMQQAVLDGTLEAGMAIANAKIVFGFTDEEAEALFTTHALSAAGKIREHEPEKPVKPEPGFERAFRRAMGAGGGAAGGYTVDGYSDPETNGKSKKKGKR